MDCYKLAVFALCLLSSTTMAAVNPGVQMRLTERGLNYVNTLAENSIKVELQALRIPDQSGQNGHLSWELTNIQVQSVAGPSSQITFNPEVSGLTWSLSNFAINLRADWHAKYKKGWIKFSDGGSLTVSLTDVSMTVAVGFGQKDGRPSISSKSCSAHIGNVDINFHGGSAQILNLFKGIVEDKIKDILESRICELVNNKINVDAEEGLSKMKVYVTIDNRFLLDYGLVAAPVISSNYLQTLNKGEVYWKADMQECPFSPGAIPEWSDFNSMLYLWLTDYTANTFVYQAHHHGYLKYNLTKDNLPEDKAGYLNTTCSSMCIGKIIKEISKAYPDCWVELQISSTAVPNAKINSQNITASALADVQLIAHTPDGSTHYILTLNVNLSLTAQASIEREKLIVTIVDHRILNMPGVKVFPIEFMWILLQCCVPYLPYTQFCGFDFDVSVLKSDIGEINVKKVKIFMAGVMTFVIIPELNKIGKEGIDLPVSGDVQFLNTKLTLLDDVLLVSTDVQYSGNLFVLSEIH